MTLSSTALIFIVLVAALASVATAAGIFGFLGPTQYAVYSTSLEQQRYMRDLRQRNLHVLLQDARPNVCLDTSFPYISALTLNL
ncbi:hypothetical protein P175DRAFT_0176048 [Aspergillus ochraceoroseus IBT 24754]|uniref:Uncharacterized protein n=1 Tax=Aspergillus ochraceoroseus IBT 24754 TaxID=1392256 RepID=A0A2T5M4Q4_9EURO|nr:uncharacterized protein P175DRAFT_0176048 [Aspergillus ochraceoroseus IBT 24754]PTU23515.1 hypothetical protein P175DRAFT_0176048 [Aspergillus ochraceoroseus IBT 24754]